MPKDQKIIQKSDLLAPDVYEKNRRQMRKELVEFKKDRRVPLGPGKRYAQINSKYKIDLVERCAGHGGTFGVMKQTHDTAVKVAKNTVSAVKRKNNKYMASDCPLAGKHIKQLAQDTNINNDEALHPIELVAKSYRL